MDDIENRVTKLEQQFEDFEKYHRERYGSITEDFKKCTDQIREDFASRVKELTDFFTEQIAVIRLGFDEYKKENRKFMLGIVAGVAILIIAAIVKGFLP